MMNWLSSSLSFGPAAGAENVKLRPELGRGITALMNFSAVGSRRLAGMMLLGKGFPVTGSIGQLDPGQMSLKSAAPLGLMSGRSCEVSTSGMVPALRPYSALNTLV